MKLAILGTGMVGRTIAARLATLGHEVALGTRDPNASRARPAPAGGQTLADWLAANPTVALMRFDDAARFGDMVLAALSGGGAVETLGAAASGIGAKILVDITNPLDFSRGMPPSLFVSNTDSLAEAIQRALPDARLVKTLNTVNANVMVEPGLVKGGEHTMFVCGNDPAARAEVADFLRTQFGWTDVMDLGDLTAARGMEAALHLWLKLWGAIGTPVFGIKVVR
ncbi:MAG: NAD(P)-binding domain-containing protein [Alphaproteobacteria bacterium]|nr:NAD(P)-binding domain-containing protein [Alphaproteobacteria bacterium]